MKFTQTLPSNYNIQGLIIKLILMMNKLSQGEEVKGCASFHTVVKM